MAITCLELTAKRRLKLGINSSGTTEWIINGTNAEDLAMSALVGSVYSPLTWIITGYGTWKGYVIDYDVEQISDVTWRGIVQYGDPTSSTKAQPVGFAQYDFEIGGGTQKVKYAVVKPDGTRAETFWGTDSVSAKGAISVDGEGNIEGIDVPSPEAKFSVTWMFSAASITPTFKQQVLYVANNPINNAAFWGYNAYEVLFLGATGRRRSSEKYELNYRFNYKPNHDGSDSSHPVVKIPGLPGDPSIIQFGHDALWIQAPPMPDPTKKIPIPNPTAAYVDQVAYASDFSLLGIGTSDIS